MAEGINNLNQNVYEGDDNPANYNQLMGMMQTKYEQSPEMMQDIVNRIGFHETGHAQRMDPAAIQQVQGGGEGVGRGLFQFETGRDQGGATAMKRLRGVLRDMIPQGKLPAWTEFDPMFGVDASKLTRKQQEMMFMANTLRHPEASFKGVTPENVGDWWQKYHYAGPEDKRALFDESMAAYNLKNTPTTEEKAFGPLLEGHSY